MSVRPLRNKLTPVLLCALCAFFLSAPAAYAEGAAPDPLSVLSRYAQVFKDRNPDLLDMLYANDYEMVIVDPPQVSFIDRTTAIKASKNMVEDKEVSSVSLTFDDGYDVAEDADTGVWRIENLRMTLAAQFVEGARMGVASHSETGCVTLYVRESAREDGTFEIFREVIFEGVGCEEE
jgi:hypothetical protein